MLLINNNVTLDCYCAECGQKIDTIVVNKDSQIQMEYSLLPPMLREHKTDTGCRGMGGWTTKEVK
jgi:hypothetical protein